MNCAGCDAELTGRQKKWCSNSLCRKAASRAAWVLKVYGLSQEEYGEILELQKGVCGLCMKPFKEGQTPHIDHEHGGPVRGIVHPYCNVRLLHRLKSWEIAYRVYEYLRFPPAAGVVGRRKAPGRPKKKRQPRKRPR